MSQYQQLYSTLEPDQNAALFEGLAPYPDHNPYSQTLQNPVSQPAAIAPSQNLSSFNQMIDICKDQLQEFSPNGKIYIFAYFYRRKRP